MIRTGVVVVTYNSAEVIERCLEACAGIERKYTEDCTAKGEPCLESGCSAEGEICLQPLLHAGSGYYKACAGAWLPIFREAKNRAEMFQH